MKQTSGMLWVALSGAKPKVAPHECSALAACFLTSSRPASKHPLAWPMHTRSGGGPHQDQGGGRRGEGGFVGEGRERGRGCTAWAAAHRRRVAAGRGALRCLGCGALPGLRCATPHRRVASEQGGTEEAGELRTKPASPLMSACRACGASRASPSSCPSGWVAGRSEGGGCALASPQPGCVPRWSGVAAQPATVALQRRGSSSMAASVNSMDALQNERTTRKQRGPTWLRPNKSSLAPKQFCSAASSSSPLPFRQPLFPIATCTRAF